jgi:hypothetical protein
LGPIPNPQSPIPITLKKSPISFEMFIMQINY